MTNVLNLIVQTVDQLGFGDVKVAENQLEIITVSLVNFKDHKNGTIINGSQNFTNRN